MNITDVADTVPWFLRREFLVGLVLVLVSAVMIRSAFGEFRTGWSLITDGTITTGVVVDVKYDHRTHYGSQRYRSIATVVTVEFKTGDGRLQRFSQTRNSPIFWAGDVGQKVAVRYLRSDPSVFEVRPLTRTDRGYVLLVIGLFAFVIGSALMVLSKYDLARGILTFERDHF